MKKFTAKMVRPGRQPKHIPNCIIHKGYVVSVRSVGKGKSWEEGGLFDGEGDSWTVHERYEDVMIPYFDGQALQRDGLLEEAKKVASSVEEVFAAGMEKYLLQFGEQDGYTVFDYEAEKERELHSSKTVSFIAHNDWETGLNYYQLDTFSGKYPEAVFVAMKKAGLYWHGKQEEDSEEGNWRGWCIVGETGIQAMSAAIQPLGWSIR